MFLNGPGRRHGPSGRVRMAERRPLTLQTGPGARGKHTHPPPSAPSAGESRRPHGRAYIRSSEDGIAGPADEGFNPPSGAEIIRHLPVCHRKLRQLSEFRAHILGRHNTHVTWQAHRQCDRMVGTMTKDAASSLTDIS